MFVFVISFVLLRIIDFWVVSRLGLWLVVLGFAWILGILLFVDDCSESKVPSYLRLQAELQVI